MGGAQKNRYEGGSEGGVRRARNFFANPPPCRGMLWRLSATQAGAAFLMGFNKNFFARPNSVTRGQAIYLGIGGLPR